MKSVFFRISELIRKIGRDEITVYAAQASFFIVISFFPFIMLLLTLIQLIPAIHKSDVMSLLIAIVPDMLDSLVIGIIDDLYTKSPATIISITAVVSLWSASKGMIGIENGLNRVYQSPNRRGYLIGRIISTGYTVFFLLSCIASLLLLVLGQSIHMFALTWIPAISGVTGFLFSTRSFMALILLVIVFTGIYTWLPVRRNTIRGQIPGALFSTLGWIVFSALFSVYFNNFSNYSYMYGSLTAVVVLMLWLYICICILFIGAEINFFLDSGENAGE